MNVAATYTSSPQNINHNSQIVHNQNYIVGSTVPRNSQSQTRVTFKSMPHAIQSQPIHPIYFAQTQPQVGQYGAPIPIQHRAQCSTFCPMHGQNNFVPMQRPVQVVRMSSMVTPTPPPPSPPPPTEPKPV